MRRSCAAPVSPQPMQLLGSQSFLCLSVHPSVPPTQFLQPPAQEGLPCLVPPASGPGEPLSGAGMISALPPTALKGFTATRAKTCQHGLKISVASSSALFREHFQSRKEKKSFANRRGIWSPNLNLPSIKHLP